MTTDTGGETARRLGVGRLALFSSAGLALGAVQIPLQTYLPALYAQQVGLSLGLVGLIFMLSRLWNAFTDPLVGLLSDRSYTRFGQRKPWIGVGSLLLFGCSYLIFFPPAGASPLYLAVGLFGLYLGWSMVATPLYAWSAELSPQYHERTRVQAYLQTFASLGLFLVLLVPALQDFSGNVSLPAKISAMGWFVLGALAFSIPLLLSLFRERPRPPLHQPGPLRLGATLRSLGADPLVLRVMASDFAVCLGQGCRGAVFLFFVTAYMGLPQWMVSLQIAQFLFGIFAAPLWLKLSYRLGKRRTLIVAEFLQIAINLSLLLLQPGQLWPLVALTVAQGLSQGSGNLMLRSIVADVADAQRLRSGEQRSGLLFSIFNVTSNAALALAVGIALPLIAWFGFVPGAVNTPEALSRLHWFFALGPATGHLLSALLIWRFPLDERGHAEIVRALAQREQSQAATAASDQDAGLALTPARAAPAL